MFVQFANIPAAIKNAIPQSEFVNVPLYGGSIDQSYQLSFEGLSVVIRITHYCVPHTNSYLHS